MRDEAEIRGHRRTYIGAVPGQIVQGLRRAGTKNPVLMLDEVDKLGMDFRGDPASALLEVLDPEQNATFRDHYLDVPFDLSRVLFITTANVIDTVPAPLRDRMELINLAGYTEEEKVAIAQRHLVPKQAFEHGLASGTDIVFEPESLRLLARGYTREAGVRSLEREIASVCRKVARRRAEGNTEPVRVAPDVVVSYLGVPRFELEEVEQRTRVPGVATGLAWTPAGGDVLFVEATRMRGAHTLTLTGQLGEVMKESVQAALSWVRSHAGELGIDAEFWEHSDVHVHVPAGAIPKDGPSAGVTMATALVSLLTARPVRPDLAMTGEISLSGRVLPVGAIKEKVLAAPRLTAAPAGAEMFKFKAPDGTTHFTNAPTDPRYQRMGFTSGTQAGWLRLPQGDPSPYAREIIDAAGRFGIPERLVTAVIRAESGFNPRAVSRKGAQGLMQLMPSTASVLGVRNSFDPRENIE